MNYDLVVIGGGAAGLAAALAAWEKGISEILIVDREEALGGILNQCIHNGFGLQYFKEELTGPEYAERFIDLLKETKVKISLDTMVIQITKNKEVIMLSKEKGLQLVQAKALILAMGCRERARGTVQIPGSRPAGVLTAGTAQHYINIEGYLPGKSVVILGSGDIGLIMARRLVLEGVEVLACIEIMPYPGGLNRNVVQCLHDYDIPLYLSHTITEIKGKDRVQQVIVSKVDEQSRLPIAGSEFAIDCDTVLLSVGLIPENELSKQADIKIDPLTTGPLVYDNKETSSSGIFACGNVLQIHDLVDFVTMESQEAGYAAAAYLKSQHSTYIKQLKVTAGTGVSYVVPQLLRLDKEKKTIKLNFRVKQAWESSVVKVLSQGELIASYQREFMLPAEMEEITVPCQFLQKANEEIVVMVEERIS